MTRGRNYVCNAAFLDLLLLTRGGRYKATRQAYPIPPYFVHSSVNDMNHT